MKPIEEILKEKDADIAELKAKLAQAVAAGEIFSNIRRER